LNVYGYPLWLLNYEDENGRGAPGVTFISNKQDGATIIKMFQALYDKYPQVSPQCFMTDKDLANIFAFNHLGIRYLLCNWHIYTAIIKEIVLLQLGVK